MSPDSSSIKLRFSSSKQVMFFQVLAQLVAATGRGGSSAQIEHSPATLNQRIVRTHLSIETYLNGSLALPIQWAFLIGAGYQTHLQCRCPSRCGRR